MKTIGLIILFISCLCSCKQNQKKESILAEFSKQAKDTTYQLPWGSKLLTTTKYPTYCWSELDEEDSIYMNAILNLETDLVKRFSYSNINTNVVYDNSNLIQEIIKKESILDYTLLKNNITYDKNSPLLKEKNNIKVKVLSLKNDMGNYLNLYTLKNKDTIDVLTVYSNENIDYYENSNYNKRNLRYYSKLIDTKVISEGDFFSGYIEKLCYIDEDFNIWIGYFVFRDEGNSLSVCYVTNEKYKLNFRDGLFKKINKPLKVNTTVYAQVETFLNVRSSPTSSGEIVAKAYPKDPLKVLEILDGWLKISFNGTEGYVSSDFVK